MGKRTGQLAGLAALGALGYMLSRDKKEAPVESRTASPNTAAPAQSAGDDYPDESRRGRMATRLEDIAPVRAVAPGPRSAGPAQTPFIGPIHEARTGDPVTNVYPDESLRGRMATIGRPVSPAAMAQGRAPMNTPQPETQTYKRTGGPRAGEEEAFRKYQAMRSPATARGPQAGEEEAYRQYQAARQGMKKGGAVKKMASGGMTTSKASSRADGIAQRGKTRGKIC